MRRIHQGVCANCGRERLDLFWHAEDQAFYCVDVWRCEARLHVSMARRLHGRPL